ncbi:MAG: tyrosine-type recombinase/integrase [Cytophagales bacterium]|nr:tyrosine-type recombinase/integrase [Cytophagales bacterium]
MIKFHLDKKKGKESPIFLDHHYRGQRIKVYTGKKIEASKWDVKACRANPRKYKTNCIGFNTFLQEVDNEVTSLENDNKSISKADLKGIIDKHSGIKTDKTFFGFSEAHLKQQIAKGDMLPSSAKGYQGTINHLRKVNPRLDFKDVDLNFHDKFVSYLRGKKIAPNSIGSHIKRLKWFMTAALERDLHSNIAFKKKAFKVAREETDQIYLTKPEINKLKNKKLPERLKKVADAFVLNCHLGMRFSDLSQIRKENFKNEKGMYNLNMVQGKTGEKISIPVPEEAMPLLRKYKFTCPVINAKNKLISVQKFNDYLKEASQEAELNEPADIRKDGTVKKFPKYQLIKSHTARRSFATNLYLDGRPIQDIMAVTGHRKEETFLLYVRADQLTKAKGLSDFYREKKEKSKPVMKVTKGGKAA